MSIKVKEFFDKATFTLTYIVYDDETKDAFVIDPVMNFDQASGEITYSSLDELMAFVKKKSLDVHYSLETHAHADHLSGAIELKNRIPKLKVGISKHITKVQTVFKNIFNLKDLVPDGAQFDILLDEEKDLIAGSLKIKTIFTPGHTPACSSFLVDDCLFVGDCMFMPDSGTGRCDFPDGSAENLYDSISNKLYKLPNSTRVFTGHDYQPGGRELEYKSTIEDQKSKNIQLKSETTQEEFIKFRTSRDEKLNAPKLLLPSIQVNIEGGRLPESEDNGMSYLKLPIKIKS